MQFEYEGVQYRFWFRYHKPVEHEYEIDVRNKMVFVEHQSLCAFRIYLVRWEPFVRRQGGAAGTVW